MPEEKSLPKPQTDLPLPEKDLPLPHPQMPEHSDGGQAEKELPANASAPTRPYKSSFILKSFLIGILSIILVLLIGGGAFLLGKKSNNNTVPIPSPSVVYEPTPTPDPTSDWKTYSDPSKLYTLKYPANWTTIEEDSNGNQIITFYPSGYPFKAPGEPATDTPYLKITLLPYVMGRGVNPLKIEQIEIDGSSYKKFYESTTDGVIETVTAPNNEGVIINFKLPQDSAKDTIDSTFDQIISTFKFTDSVTAIPTGGQTFCTQEAKLCPDGKTYVSRHGPNCEFEKCPAEQ